MTRQDSLHDQLDDVVKTLRTRGDMEPCNWIQTCLTGTLVSCPRPAFLRAYMCANAMGCYDAGDTLSAWYVYSSTTVA